MLSRFIIEVSADEKNASPNFTYILFEACALTLTFIKENRESFVAFEDQITPALNSIIQQNLTDLSGYAFQLYSTFVASSAELRPNYEVLAKSVITSTSNWQKEMKYLIPALTVYLNTVISKHPGYVKQYIPNIMQISQHLLSPEMRLEQASLQIASTVFERVEKGFDNGEFL